MEPIVSLLADVLAALGGGDRYISGATLGLKAHAAAEAQGLNLKDSLKSANSSILQLLLMSSRFEVIRRPGTDFLVRLKSRANEVLGEEQPDPVPAADRRLRADVYDAFTRVGKRLVYNRSSDRFVDITGAEIPADSVPVPPVDSDELTKDREAFADTLDQPLRDALNTALQRSSGLKEFKEILKARRRFNEWINFHNQLLSSRISTWAAENGLGFRDTWLEPAESTLKSSENFRRAAARLIMSMSDDDLGRLLIPLNYLRQYLDR